MHFGRDGRIDGRARRDRLHRFADPDPTEHPHPDLGELHVGWIAQVDGALHLGGESSILAHDDGEHGRRHQPGQLGARSVQQERAWTSTIWYEP